MSVSFVAGSGRISLVTRSDSSAWNESDPGYITAVLQKDVNNRVIIDIFGLNSVYRSRYKFGINGTGTSTVDIIVNIPDGLNVLDLMICGSTLSVLINGVIETSFTDSKFATYSKATFTNHLITFSNLSSSTYDCNAESGSRKPTTTTLQPWVIPVIGVVVVVLALGGIGGGIYIYKRKKKVKLST